MLAYNLKDILALVPEARELVKQASLEEDFPTNNKDSVCASYLRMGYLAKVAGKSVDESITRVLEKAAEMYGVRKQLDTLSKKLEKKASVEKADLVGAFVLAKDRLSLDGIEKVASAAKALEGKDVPSYIADDVSLYSAATLLNKEAAVHALANRYIASNNEGFKKLAYLVIRNLKENDYDNISKVCSTVTTMDKAAGLDLLGFNFYTEALVPMTKVAAFSSSLGVTLVGEQIPYEKIQKFGKDRISSVLGKDVAAGLTDDPVNNKYMIESLPRDLQIVLKAQLKNV